MFRRKIMLSIIPTKTLQCTKVYQSAPFLEDLTPDRIDTRTPLTIHGTAYYTYGGSFRSTYVNSLLTHKQTCTTMAEDDTFIIGSPFTGTFEYQMQPQATDGAHVGTFQLSGTLASTLTNLASLIEGLLGYVDTIVKRSDDTTAALKQDMSRLAESIQRVEERLTYLVTNSNSRKQDIENSNTHDTAGITSSIKDDDTIALLEVKDDISGLSDSIGILEQRLGSLEGRVINIKQVMLKNIKRNKTCNKTKVSQE